MSHIVTREQFAEMCNVKKSSIGQALKGSIRAAAVGERVDAEHPDAVAYFNRQWGIEEKGLVGSAAAKETRKMRGRPKLPTPEQLAERTGLSVPATNGATPPFAAANPEINAAANRGVQPPPFANGSIERLPEDVRAYADWSLRALMAQFGSDVAFSDWLKSYKTIEEVHAKQLANAETEGRLISRDLVDKVVFSHIETMTVRLLSDGSKTIARRVHEMAKAGRTPEECERFVADQITSFVMPMKEKMRKGMQNA